MLKHAKKSRPLIKTYSVAGSCKIKQKKTKHKLKFDASVRKLALN